MSDGYEKLNITDLDAICKVVKDNDVRIQPCHSDEFPSPVQRPSYSFLDKTKVKETFGVKIPYWTESLKKCISNLQYK